MTADSTAQAPSIPATTIERWPEPSPVRRTPQQKLRILANLTIALAALNQPEAKADVNA